MKTTYLSSHLRHFILPLSIAVFPACATEAVDESDEIATALEQENGGLDDLDEAPRFGADDEYEDAQIEPETDYDDPMESTPEVASDMSVPDAVVFATTVLWGQMPPDRENDTPHIWDGTLSVNRGAILIRRVIAFEDRGYDELLPRTDRQSVNFQSRTRPHMDGLRLAIVDPAPGSEPLVLTYTPADSTAPAFSATMAELVAGPVSHEVDDAGNRLVAVATPRRPDPCAHGTLRGRWHRVDDGRGRLIGEVADDEGALIGHVRGVFGRRASGEHVFFGKYIDLDGRFRGIFAGGYGDGAFRGRWLERRGEDRGVLGGEYRESRPGPEVGGHFLGRWAETSCNLRLDR